jgi:hypothetical protein
MGRGARSLTCLVRDRSQRVVSRRARRRRDRAHVRLDRPPDGLDEDDAVEQGYVVIGDDGVEVRIRRRADQATATVKSGPRMVRNEEIASDARRLGPRDGRQARHAGLSLQHGIRVPAPRSGRLSPPTSFERRAHVRIWRAKRERRLEHTTRLLLDEERAWPVGRARRSLRRRAGHLARRHLRFRSVGGSAREPDQRSEGASRGRSSTRPREPATPAFDRRCGPVSLIVSGQAFSVVNARDAREAVHLVENMT